MRPEADLILQHLHQVADERARRAADAALGRRTEALKHYQQQRFRRTYADLLASPRYGPPARFFLEELYGPGDFSDRDAQFARIVPAIVKLFPGRIVGTVTMLAELHALSERVDTAMATHLADGPIDAAGYVAAWQATGQPEARERQVRLTVEVGEALDGYARTPMLRTTLRMMRGPAHAAGLTLLQRFLETGFDTFKAMRGAREFLDTVATRERTLVTALFAADAVAQVTGLRTDGPRRDSPLVQLP